MKIYKSKHGSFYFGQTPENGWFSFHSHPPDIDDLKLCASSFNSNEEKVAWSHGVAVDIPEDIERSVFNKFVNNPTGNYQAVCDFIRTYYPETTQEELDNEFQHYPHIIELVDSVVNNLEWWDSMHAWHYSSLYREAKSLLGTWDNDVERVKKYIIEHEVEKCRSFYHAMVDVFGECHPTKRKLLHDFYHQWGDDLDNVIEKSIELYPDEKDFDKAFYYTRDAMENLRGKKMKLLKEKFKHKQQ